MCRAESGQVNLTAETEQIVCRLLNIRRMAMCLGRDRVMGFVNGRVGRRPDNSITWIKAGKSHLLQLVPEHLWVAGLVRRIDTVA